MKPGAGRGSEDGVILINVLVILALAGIVLSAMLTLGDLSIRRGQAFADGAQVSALIQAGEQSAIVALRRDMIEAPGSDYPAEAWGAAQQEAIRIAGGSFELRIEDAQDKVNINSLIGGGLRFKSLAEAIAGAVGLPQEELPGLLAVFSLGGAPTRVSEIADRAGLDEDQRETLGQLVTILPGTGDVNINTASAAVIGLLLGNPAKGHILERMRARKGFLTQDDIDTAQVILPSGLGFRSNLFRVVTTVRLGETTQTMASLLRRHNGPDGPTVSVIARENLTAAGVTPPPSIN